MSARLRTALAILISLAFVASACGGEVTVSVDDDDGTAAPATEAPAASEPDTSEPDDEPEAPAAEETTTTEPDEESEAPATTEPDEEPEAVETAEPDDSDGVPAEETTTTEPAEPEGPPPNIFDDPRGGIFNEYQASMDRGDHPFMQVDSFCSAHPAAADRVATDKGIEADSIKITHIRSKLEDFAAIGFGTDVGDPAEMFETFVTYINEQCGGVRGRLIDLHTIHVDVLGDQLDEIRNAACIEAIEDNDAVIIVNSSGFQGSATLCIVEENETAFITVQPQPEEFMGRSGDRLITMTPTAEEALGWLALDLIQRGELDGKIVGIAAPDTPGQFEAVEAGLVNILRDHGVNVAVFDKVGCGGGIACTEGAVDTVARFRSEGVDVIFNVLNVISAPLFLTEMLNQGFQPGDVQFYASDFNSQATEIVASKIVQFGGVAAGELYHGARIMDSRDTGAYRLEGYEPRAFNEMCNDLYGAHSPSGTNHESEDRHDGNSRYGMVGSVCTVLRTALRAIYDSGDNPTRADVYATLANLGPIDTNEMIPGSIRPGKTRVPDALHNLVWEFPCTKPYGLPVPGFEDAGGTCIYPVDEFRPAPS
jgi:hypothetical protein